MSDDVWYLQHIEHLIPFCPFCAFFLLPPQGAHQGPHRHRRLRGDPLGQRQGIGLRCRTIGRQLRDEAKFFGLRSNRIQPEMEQMELDLVQLGTWKDMERPFFSFHFDRSKLTKIGPWRKHWNKKEWVWVWSSIFLTWNGDVGKKGTPIIACVQIQKAPSHTT